MLFLTRRPPISPASAHHRRWNRSGRLTATERRAALAAPAPTGGFSSRWVQVAGLRLHVRERITADAATPCVLLHGLAVSHRYLMPTALRLGGRSVYVPDLPGFGLSGKPGAVLDVVQHAEAVAAFMETLGVASAAILGNSFGCQVAVELAVRRPDLVAALILVGPTTDPTAATMTGQLRRLLRDLPREDWRQTPILARDLRDAGPRRIVATLRHAIEDHIDAKLPAISVPTLLVRGDLDPIAPARWVDQAVLLTPGGRTLTIAAAHNAVTTAGPKLAAAVDTFLHGDADLDHIAARSKAPPPGGSDKHLLRVGRHDGDDDRTWGRRRAVTILVLGDDQRVS
ncbi:alpha/beta fold hydrolase [Micromonospora sp. NPDC004704]